MSTTEPHTASTITEREVEQVSRGLSNREIGQRLYLSHRTVGSHLYRVFPKLGVSGRSELRAALDDTYSRGPRLTSSHLKPLLWRRHDAKSSSTIGELPIADLSSAPSEENRGY